MKFRRCRSCGVINGPLHYVGCKGVDWELVEKIEAMSEHEDYDEVQARVPTGSGEVRTTSSTGGQKGVKLERFDLIPIGPLTHLARHYGAGALKYDDHQWRNAYEWSKSYAALLRHLTAFWNGEEWDVCPSGTDEAGEWYGDSGCVVQKPGSEEPAIGWTDNGRTCYNHTGSHHLDGVMWHAFALREFVDKFPEHDDRFKG